MMLMVAFFAGRLRSANRPQGELAKALERGALMANNLISMLIHEGVVEQHRDPAPVAGSKHGYEKLWPGWI